MYISLALCQELGTNIRGALLSYKEMMRLAENDRFADPTTFNHDAHKEKVYYQGEFDEGRLELQFALSQRKSKMSPTAVDTFYASVKDARAHLETYNRSVNSQRWASRYNVACSYLVDNPVDKDNAAKLLAESVAEATHSSELANAYWHFIQSNVTDKNYTVSVVNNCYELVALFKQLYPTEGDAFDLDFAADNRLR